MSRWRLETTVEFDRAARKLDRTALRRIRAYLTEVTEREDPRARGRALTVNRAGYWRYRIGDYRVIVQIVDDQLVLIALSVGHRSAVYRD